MKCEKHKNMFVLHAFSYGKCEQCNEGITTSYTPCNKVCESCSNKYSICKICGDKIEQSKNKLQ